MELNDALRAIHVVPGQYGKMLFTVHGYDNNIIVKTKWQ